jgi:hypothetical protein
LTIFLRKRLSNESCDSPLRKFTVANEITYLLVFFVRYTKRGHKLRFSSTDSAGDKSPPQRMKVG